MKRRAVKKSVSFHAQVSDNPVDRQENKLEIPGEVKSVLALPFHLFVVLYSLFQAGLTDDPFKGMVKGLVSLIVMQFVYGFLLLRSEKKSTIGKGKTLRHQGDNDVLLVFSSTIISAILANAMFVVLILFGAPLYGFRKETYLLACHLSIIIFQPLLILFRLDYNEFGKIFKHDNSYQIVFRNQTLSACLISLLGSWLGVIPIPLDWDRPWQQWPTTILIGGYIGAFAGSLLALFL
ncbi:hypothetical protein JCM33374_g538 [Metschnikowia sp. JCM 33374]|nr:hypothetical protein JCM33374_g538 [Metschnikowia sp. JCM 33374]